MKYTVISLFRVGDRVFKPGMTIQPETMPELTLNFEALTSEGKLKFEKTRKKRSLLHTSVEL